MKWQTTILMIALGIGQLSGQGYNLCQDTISRLKQQISILKGEVLKLGGNPDVMHRSDSYQPRYTLPASSNSYSAVTPTTSGNTSLPSYDTFVQEVHGTSSTYAKAINFRGQFYYVFAVNLRDYNTNIDLFWGKRDNSQQPLGNFENLEKSYQSKGQLIFAMNAGMFEQNGRAKGLLVSNKFKENEFIPVQSVSAEHNRGNFYLHPNGIFLIDLYDRAQILPSEKYQSGMFENVDFKSATQSGPMLIMNGQINKGFNPTSQNRSIRNGVGVVRDDLVVFALSAEPVTFYEFASLYQHLGCRNALFLDGAISQMYCPKLNLNNKYVQLGPMIGVFRK